MLKPTTLLIAAFLTAVIGIITVISLASAGTTVMVCTAIPFLIVWGICMKTYYANY